MKIPPSLFDSSTTGVNVVSVNVIADDMVSANMVSPNVVSANMVPSNSVSANLVSANVVRMTKRNQKYIMQNLITHLFLSPKICEIQRPSLSKIKLIKYV